MIGLLNDSSPRKSSSPHQVWKLLQDQNNTNGSQHSFDHGIGYIIADDACPDTSENDLKTPASTTVIRNASQLGRVAIPPCHDHGQTGGRPTYTQLRTTLRSRSLRLQQFLLSDLRTWALDPSAMPRQSGIATSRTTILAGKSAPIERKGLVFIFRLQQIVKGIV